MKKVKGRSNRVKEKGRIGTWLSYIVPCVQVVALMVFTLTLSRSVNADVFNVFSGDIDALIDAINTANSNDEADTINLAAGTYTLTAADNDTDGANGIPSITTQITINGAGADTTIIERNGSAPNFRLLHVAPSGKLTIDGLTIKGGFIECCDTGGGIFTRGPLFVINSIITENSSDYEGGGIASESTGIVSITESFITANSAQDGGGIFARGSLTIDASEISQNSTEGFGGGIWGTATITNSNIKGNTTEFTGAGIFGAVDIRNSVVSDNISGGSGGGMSLTGISEITNCTISNNMADSGSGIHCGGEQIAIANSSFVENYSEFGFGYAIYISQGTANITNSTISNPGESGIVTNEGIIAIENATIVNNFEGIYVIDQTVFTATVTMRNTILADNSFDCNGPVTSLGNNLIESPSGCGITLKSSDLMGDPRLGTFTDDGTPGNAHFPLLAASQAIDAGNNPACPETDQVGFIRPADGDDNGTNICDIGAIEFGSTPLTCSGFTVTIFGTEGNDTIPGTSGRDVIHGLGGNDTINGFGGNDIICGGNGNDTLNGNVGNDRLFGQNGNDKLRGGKDKDILSGGRDNDILNGNRGNDTLNGNLGNDLLYGDIGDDVMNGGDGIDRCNGGPHITGDTANPSCETIAKVP